VTRGTREPYRVFTSRAEYRLLLGVDTASRRLSGHGERVGLLPPDRATATRSRWQRIDSAVGGLAKERWLPDNATVAKLATAGIDLDAPSSTADLLKRPELSGQVLAPFSPILTSLSKEDRRIAAETIKYAGYVERQRREAERVAKAGVRKIPERFSYDGIPGLSNELVEKLDQARPVTLGHASRVDGMTPAAMAILTIWLEKRKSG
jgi:tRNA uridine 5-carboxymethylaminomethyl modification enzyme